METIIIKLALPANGSSEPESTHEIVPLNLRPAEAGVEPLPIEPVPPRADAGPTYLFNTRIKLFVLSTGGDPGSRCEIRGKLTTNSGISKDVSLDLPVKSNFVGENNGLGRLVVEIDKISASTPATFEARLYEEGNIVTPDRVFVGRTVNWNTTDYPEWYNAKVYLEQSQNSADKGYVGHLWWQVTGLGYYYDQ
ncbi:hypothetical protein MMC24_004223 [Lignoscripta atroalba]|nr:hypothetical protein [Lignoscripta atroalba]